MSEWTVRVTIATPAVLNEQDLEALADLADKDDASVSTRSDGPGYTVTVDVEAHDLLAAGRTGVSFARSTAGANFPGTVVDLRVTTPEQYEAEALRPDFPPLASASDAAEILGVSRQRVHQLAASNTRFPAPIARVGSGPLWTVPAIEHFDRIWERKPGRPQRKDDSEPESDDELPREGMVLVEPDSEPLSVPSPKSGNEWYHRSASQAGDHPQRREA